MAKINGNDILFSSQINIGDGSGSAPNHTLQDAKDYTDAEIEKLRQEIPEYNEITVDTNYNSNSLNPQSGKAVAQAIEEALADIPTGGEGTTGGRLYQHLLTFSFDANDIGDKSGGCVSVYIINQRNTAYVTKDDVLSIRAKGNIANGHLYDTDTDAQNVLGVITSIDFEENKTTVYYCNLVHQNASPIPLVLQNYNSFTIRDVTDIVTTIPVSVLEAEGGNVDVSGVVSQAVAESKSYTDNIIANLNLSGGSTTEATIPTYWASMVTGKTATVKALQTEGGKNSVSFVWASDTHIPDNHATRTNDIGKVMAKIMDNCEIPFAMISGDVGTRASCSTEENLIANQSKMPQHLAPLWGTDRLLMALGNHDGCWGDSTGYYRHQFPPERMWQVYFRGQALDFRRVFSDDGLYFFVDNIAQKTRFIVLNSQFGGEYAEDENGWAVNNRFSVSCYGQAQLDWLANVALDMPEGYGAIITSHVPLNESYTVDRLQLIGIINAYCNKTTFEGSYTAGVEGWSNSTVSVDFTEAKGEILAMFAGHVHGDSVDTKTLACPLITILSAGAPANGAYEENAPTRTVGTDTETSFDVVTINRATKTIYCTRIGGGADRVIAYGEPNAPTNLAGTFVPGRLSASSGEIVSAVNNGSYPDYAQAMEEYIPAVEGDVFRIKGLGALTDYNTVTYYTDSTGAIKPQNGSKANAAPDNWVYSYDEASGIVTLEMLNPNSSHIRFSGVPFDESGNPITTTDHIIITKNEEIV